MMTLGERRAVEIVRVFDAPRATVFNMWIDPWKLAKWLGPEGNRIILCELDPRPGGAMKITDQGPDGSTYPFTGTFEKIVVPELLVFKTVSLGFGNWGPWEVLNTVTFEELSPRRTRVKLVVKVLKGVPEETEALEQGFRGGWGESFDKLQRSLVLE